MVPLREGSMILSFLFPFFFVELACCLCDLRGLWTTVVEIWRLLFEPERRRIRRQWLEFCRFSWLLEVLGVSGRGLDCISLNFNLMVLHCVAAVMLLTRGAIYDCG